MEVKVNREIRDYTESMFFGLSLRQFIFFCPGMRSRSRHLSRPQAGPGHRGHQLALHRGGVPVRHAGIPEVQRNDSREVHPGMDQIRDTHA